MQSWEYLLKAEFTMAQVDTEDFYSCRVELYTALLGTEDASCLSRLPLAFITMDAWGMTHGMLVHVQRGLNAGSYLCHKTICWWGLLNLCTLLSALPVFDRIISIFFQNCLFVSTSLRFSCNSNVLCVTSASMAEIAGNPDLLWVKLEWNSLD